MAKSKEKTLLVVEDEPNLLQGIRDILQLDGYEVITASHGKQALDVLQSAGEDLPDLIVSDIMMPFMNGIELLQHVRNEKKWKLIPFLFLTARGEMEDVRQGKRLGADDHLIKPFDADDLLVAVRAKIAHSERVREANQEAISIMKERIMRIINHEFRTPLTLVVAYSEMLREGRDSAEVLGSDDLLLFLHEINAGADRLRRLVENFMLLIELDSAEAQKTYDWRKRQIHEFEKILDAAHEQVMGRDGVNHFCDLQMQSPLPTIIGDPEYLTIILRELLDNAVKFSEPHQPISLQVYADGDDLVVSVSDGGHGIPEDELDNIFEVLHQVNREVYEMQGSGSGLAIVRGLVEIHGGEVSVTSTEGEGSTFVVRFPIMD